MSFFCSSPCILCNESELKSALFKKAVPRVGVVLYILFLAYIWDSLSDVNYPFRVRTGYPTLYRLTLYRRTTNAEKF